VLRVGEQEHGKPQVDLADLRIAWQRDGTFHAIAAFDLDPAGTESCPIALPPGCSLVQILVGGQSTLVASRAENRWDVPLESTTLPQRIEVLYAGRVPAPGGAGLRDFAVPAPGEIPVRQSVWAVSAPSVYRLRAEEPGQELTRLQHALAELRSLTAIVQRVAEIPAVDPEPLERWYRDWARRWNAARVEVVRQLVWAGAAYEAASVRTELEALEKRQATASERLGLSDLFAQVAAHSTPQAEPAALWRSAQDDRRPAILFGTSSTLSPVTIFHEPASNSDASSRLMALLGVAMLGAAAAWGTRRGILPKFFLHWPYVTGVFAGWAWWWWLQPSVAGFSIALASLVAAAWSLWRRWRRAAATLVPLSP